MIVRKLTRDSHPKLRERVWLFRDDQKIWVVEKMTESIIGWIGHPDLAYTHWCELQEPPKPCD